MNKTTLYRYFDSEGQLLYVGITGDNTKRQSQHRRNSFWFGLIGSATFEHYDSKDEALNAETIAIENESPKHNQKYGIVISHSPWAHMLLCSAEPDGGHNREHKLFASLMKIGMRLYDGTLPTANQVLASAMIFAYIPKRNNLVTCHLCQSAFNEKWFKDAVKEMERDGTLWLQQYKGLDK